MKTLFSAIFLSIVFFSSRAALASDFKVQNVFTDDVRTRVTDSHAPWTAIGKLLLPTGGYCSATLVARNLILTAAHCLFENKVLTQGEYQFYPEYGNSDGTYSTVNYFWWGTNDPDTSRGSDWAIARLDENLGDSYGWMGVESMTAEELLQKREYYLGAYSGDFDNGNVASWEKGCEFKKFDVQNGFMLHNCDMSRGASGAGIFYYKDSNNTQTSAYIVALNVAEYRDGKDQSLIGIPYSDDHANIAVPSSVFYSTLENILNGKE